MKEIINDVRVEVFDAFVGEDWFYDIRFVELSDKEYEVELIVNDNFNISDLNDVKDELRFYGFKIYDDHYFITKRNVKDIYLVTFLIKGIE